MNIKILTQAHLHLAVFKVIVFCFLMTSSAVWAQKTDSLNSSIYEEIEKIAVYPDGNEAFRNQIAKNFRSRKVKISESVSCTLSFVVARDGSITDIKASGSNEDFNKEAIYALSKIRKKFIPATINGEPVRYSFRIPYYRSRNS